MESLDIKTNNCSIPEIMDKEGSYRLGDMLMVYTTTDLSDHFCMKNDKFKGTIMNRFGIKIKNHSQKLNRCLVCAEVINDMIKEKKYDHGDKDDLVIHIRLGDVFGLDNNVCISKRPNMDKIIHKIKKFKGKKIYIVTAYIYGKGGYSAPEVIEKGQKRSEEFLEKIIKSIPSEKEYEIKSSENADNDFIFLTASPNLYITGNSCFSVAADKVNNYLMKLLK